MQYLTLGAQGPSVSAVGFGGMHLSITDRPEESVAIRTLHAALDAGITLIDTADVYCLDDAEIGHNERLIRTALASWSGQQGDILVATKGGMRRPEGRWERDGRPAHLRTACERSLKALGVSSIGLYQLHAPDPRVPWADSIGELARLRDEGKVQRIGISNVNAAQLEEARRMVPVTSVQNRLNPFFREALDGGVVAACERAGIGFLAYSPVGGGRLNLRLPSHPIVSAIAARHGASAHAVVLAWVRSLGTGVVPIPSARSAAHARDSAASASLDLPAADLDAITGADFPTD